MNHSSDDQNLVHCRLVEDLIGPYQPDEELHSRPSDCYLTGVLWPMLTQMSGEDDDKLGMASSNSETDVDRERDSVHVQSMRKPSVAGLSFCVGSNKSPMVDVAVEFATYAPRQRKRNDKDETVWCRKPHALKRTLDVSDNGPLALIEEKLDESRLNIKLNVRSIDYQDSKLVTLTVVNESQPMHDTRKSKESATIFQVSIDVTACEGTALVPKPGRKELFETRKDKQGAQLGNFSDRDSAALLYRNVFEYAVGHVCSARWKSSNKRYEGKPTAECVSTTWIPSARVYPVDPNGHQILRDSIRGQHLFDNLSAKTIANETPANLKKGLHSFCDAYGQWLDGQRKRIDSPDDVSVELRHVAVSQLSRCESALKRMKNSADAISEDNRLRRAFQLANFAMDVQYEWSHRNSEGKTLKWRPFQLAFLLLSAPSTVNRDHPDREFMDLLWFPTGGGKTEAYLALIACLAVYKRLSGDPLDHRGVYALMRYTLRLLTTQQFARAAAMIVALEAMRTGRIPMPEGLSLQGTDPFSIGLWVGGDATPNNRKVALQSRGGDTSISSPKQLAKCPACGGELIWKLEVSNSPISPECETDDCCVRGVLPVYTVDDDIYDRRPTLLIGTTDKFAQVVREGRTNGLFGIQDKNPPELILQDELHLISGPLGTIAGIYETAFDLMFMRDRKKSKIVGSTATINMATEQVRALFDREAFQFPPPAIDHNDSGFAVVDTGNIARARKYLGVSTAGRSAKFVLQAVSGSLLQTAFAAFKDSDRKDAYWTLVGYFNSLRELGGALVLMRDDVTDSIDLYAKRRDEDARLHPYVEELTSRRTQSEILDMLQELEVGRDDGGAIDAVLATNMISVGVDISRLALMLVAGQPKSIAEYIQSTSRVGRADVAGLIVSVLNNAKARDRSHYETFKSWHMALYKDVEATSVTPFASRARDRALHAALVASVRHLVPEMLENPTLGNQHDEKIGEIVDYIVERAKRIDPDETSVRQELDALLERWRIMKPEFYWKNKSTNTSLLQSAEQAAERTAAGHGESSAWPTLNSMRTVEPATPFRMTHRLIEAEDQNGE